MNEIFLDHLHRYPCMTLEDVYKLIHQAAMGSAHAIKDIVSARAWRSQEISTLGEGPTELLIDPIASDGRIVRIHLRPFVDRKLDPESLILAFVLTAKEFAGSTEPLREYADVAIKLAEEQRFPFSYNLNRLLS